MIPNCGGGRKEEIVRMQATKEEEEDTFMQGGGMDICSENTPFGCQRRKKGGSGNIFRNIDAAGSLGHSKVSKYTSANRCFILTD